MGGRWLVGLVLCGCYSARPQAGSPCSATSPCPDPLVCSAVSQTCVDSSTPVDGRLLADAAPDARGDAGPSCFGASGWSICLDTLPTSPITTPAFIETDEPGSTLCAAVQPTSWSTAGQPVACIVIATDIHITTDTTASGDRPIVFVATNSIDISGTLDAASHDVSDGEGAGALGNPCSSFPATPGSNTTGAGGGAGGSFMTKGANGGSGDAGAAIRGTSPLADSTAPAHLRGGCPGQDGGDGAVAANGGGGGRGGGAVYLVAGTSIAISGVVNASAALGQGGGLASGGGGGGSGGLIRLYAPSITVTGKLVANGSGGAAGGTAALNGVDGSDPDATMPLSPAGGGTGAGGNGGAGYAGGTSPTGGMAGTAGLGGGGGGGGAGYIRSNLPLTGATTSPAATIL